ncbi:MAG: signal recognition particle-docking protein FtsY [Chloroflexi bacterium]|nr:signal recognition particle-docking protein FtsY [Chloroflexota bacterium]
MDLLRRTREALRRTREGVLGRLGQLLERPRFGEELWAELEELLLLADVGVPTTRLLVEKVKDRARREGLTAGAQVQGALAAEIEGLLRVDTRPAPPSVSPLVILFVGVNGSGKTTSIAKLAHSYKEQGERVVLAAADTFRAAAIDQLRVWGERAGAEVIAHQPGADPGAVVFDAIEAARKRQAGVVLIDTAGRLHTKYNLMEELKKIKRVASRHDPTAPHQVLLVLDATTGQNGLIQARHFAEAVEVSGIFLAKLDGTAKGGIVLAIAQELRIPILYIGTGEKLEDMAAFDPRAFAEALCST